MAIPANVATGARRHFTSSMSDMGLSSTVSQTTIKVIKEKAAQIAGGSVLVSIYLTSTGSP